MRCLAATLATREVAEQGVPERFANIRLVATTRLDEVALCHDGSEPAQCLNADTARGRGRARSVARRLGGGCRDAERLLHLGERLFDVPE